jgi:MerR family transcriptional regulator/heat shock protein HspR
MVAKRNAAKGDWKVREYVEPKLTSDDELITISAFAKRLRLHPQTLRNWEKAGLIAPKRIGRERVYNKLDLERALLIKKYAKKGSSLKGIRALLEEMV